MNYSLFSRDNTVILHFPSRSLTYDSLFAFAIDAVLYKDYMMFNLSTDEYQIEKRRLILSGNTHTIILGKLTGMFPRTHELDTSCGSTGS